MRVDYCEVSFQKGLHFCERNDRGGVKNYGNSKEEPKICNHHKLFIENSSDSTRLCG